MVKTTRTDTNKDLGAATGADKGTPALIQIDKKLKHILIRGIV